MNPLLALTSVFGLFGAGRSPAALLNITVPHSGYCVIRDIAYGIGPRHHMDLYLPPHARESAPVVVFFYGGAFRAGRKSEYRFVGEALASRGIIVAVPDYRTYPTARFPDFLDDGAAALVKAREIAAAYGGDPERLFVAGHSAGAYIAVMLAANPAWLQGQGGSVSSIRGVIALSGRYHDSPLQDETAERIFGGLARDETRPAFFIRGAGPPMLLAAGSREGAAVLEGKERLAGHLRAHGSHVEEALYPGIGHAGIMLALAPGFRGRGPVREDIIRFVQSH